jgi:hypothetical protein
MVRRLNFDSAADELAKRKHCIIGSHISVSRLSNRIREAPTLLKLTEGDSP